ncbi:hypothetical protein CYMTET_56139 [Cymbomonas tetramitiformis]|uniref:Uncharacterized protein n=1 Tax=Cymbomonas tetramitiformis TaxID=36881 RepID=A0AAE0BBW7_9CHLO|nr:hypothetical protein CYMTET_56139 [Cymbomonas tetramitiformis]
MAICLAPTLFLTVTGGELLLTSSRQGCVPPAVRQKLQAEHSSLVYPAKVDPRPILAKDQQLVRENRAADWNLTATTRKQQLWESLDPDFYAAVRVRYPRLADLQNISLSELSDLVASIYVSWHTSHADQGDTTGTAASAVVSPGDDIVARLFAKIERIENFIKSQRAGGAAAVLPSKTRKGLAGFRVGARPDPQVGFDG